MRPMTPTMRLASTAAMFGITLVFLVVASATHDVWPLFVGWIPLLAVPWLLTRPEADAAAGGAVADEGAGSPEPQESGGEVSPGDVPDAEPDAEG